MTSAAAPACRCIWLSGSSNAIAAATSFARHGERFQAMCLPAEEQPALSGFDVVLLIDVLHHVPPAVQQDFLRSIVRRMDRGARLVLLDIDREAFARRCCNQLHDLLLSHHRGCATRTQTACRTTGRVP